MREIFLFEFLLSGWETVIKVYSEIHQNDPPNFTLERETTALLLLLEKISRWSVPGVCVQSPINLSGMEAAPGFPLSVHSGLAHEHAPVSAGCWPLSKGY